MVAQPGHERLMSLPDITQAGMHGGVKTLHAGRAASSAKPAEPGVAPADAQAAPAIPPMPPGWKPGDAVPDAEPVAAAPSLAAPAPSWEAVTAGPAAAAGAGRPPPPPPPPPPVPNSAFDFILNPDLEEVEEAYSSDEAYSDDA